MDFYSFCTEICEILISLWKCTNRKIVMLYYNIEGIYLEKGLLINI